MIRNYLKVTIRNLKRNKSYTLINITGLAVGIAVCLLLLLFVRNELTYDRFHEKSGHTFRIIFEGDQPANEDIDMTRSVSTPYPLGPLLQNLLPEVTRFVRLNASNQTILIGNQPYHEELLFTDPTFFEVFSFPLRSGNPDLVLKQPNTVVLSAEAAEKYFNDQNPLGKELTISFSDTTHVMTIGGVAEPLPPNSSITFSILLPFPESVNSRGWRSRSPQTFIELSDLEQKDQVRTKLPTLIAEHIPELGRPNGLDLQPLADIHFSKIPADELPTGQPIYAYILAGIAGFILLIACINFTTLSIGRSASRAQEVGMRKSLGARRAQLAGQFWGEAALVVLASTTVGIALARLSLPVFNNLLGKELALFTFTPWSTLAMVGGLALLVSLLAGAYPAFFLSRFEPAEVFKGDFGLGGRRRLTRSLVALQFGLSIFLITGTVVMYQQLDLLTTKELGFDEEQVVRINTTFRGANEVFHRLKSELADQPDVIGVAGSFNQIASDKVRGFENSWSVESNGRSVRARPFRVTSEIVNTLGLKLKSGVSFAEAESQKSAIVNESLVRAFGWEQPTEQFINNDIPVIGVVQDFNYRSLRYPVEPLLIMRMGGYPVSGIYVRLAPGSLPASLDLLRSTWQKVAPEDKPFQYDFLDEAIDKSYLSVQQWTRIIGYGSLFAIAVACLGLFGLATLSTQRRRQEIGIRKVLGASVTSVAALLAKDFARLVLIGFVMAVPFVYYAAQMWLENFAYRIDTGPWIFVGAGLLAGAISMATVAYQAVQAALLNPAKSLRSE